jgi:hypothetical protein
MDAFFAKGGVVDPEHTAPDCPKQIEWPSARQLLAALW